MADGAQFVLATHSPLLMRAGGRVIYELDDGIRLTCCDDLEIVGLWRHFLDAPERVLDVLYADD